MNIPDLITCVAAALAVVPACKRREDTPTRPAATSAPSSPADAATPAPATAPASLSGSNDPPPPSLGPVTKWELDPENSSVTFVCKHANRTNVRGMFQKPAGAVVLDLATPAHSSVHATIDVKSITTGVEERDSHLKGDEFFDAATYPTISFVSTGVTRSGDTDYAVIGNLTMHGVTRPVTLAVTTSPPFLHYGSIRLAVEATTSVNRQDFGVGVAAWNVPAESGGLLIANTVQITIDAELVLQPESSTGG